MLAFRYSGSLNYLIEGFFKFRERAVKKRSYDISLLLVILIVFSASLGVLHGGKKTLNIHHLPPQTDTYIDMTTRDALDFIDPLLLAGNMDMVAQVLHQFSPDVFEEAIDTILSDEYSNVSKEQKLILLLAAIEHNKMRHRNTMILSKLLEYFQDMPVYYYAASNYPGVISFLISRKGSDHIQAYWKEKSFERAIDEGNGKVLQILYDNKIKPDHMRASKLLHRVVTGTSYVPLISFLVEKWKADPNYSADKKRTLLIEAVEENKPEMVEALLQVGANRYLVLDKSVGSAKQRAFDRGYVAIEAMLSKKK